MGADVENIEWETRLTSLVDRKVENECVGDRSRSFSVVSLDRERVRDLYGLKVQKFREFRSE